MATSTFDKKKRLGRKAAKRLAEIASSPVPPRPSNEELDAFWEEDRNTKAWIESHCKNN